MSILTENVSVNPDEIQVDKTYFGKCKWFNSKSGFGFITFKNDKGNMNDIFVHHNSINVSNEQYKYLVIGEYLQFKICENDSNQKHKYFASSVEGIDCGKLMCETRKDFREIRNKYKSQKEKNVLPL
jgi:cold shock CspA family protein